MRIVRFVAFFSMAAMLATSSIAGPLTNAGKILEGGKTVGTAATRS